MTTPVTVNYYFCLLSPWTYLGQPRFARMAAAAGAVVNYRPVRILDVFAISGGVTLKKRSVQRKAYRMMELRRWRHALDIPMNLEPRFEFPETDLPATLALLGAMRLGADPAQLMFAFLRAMWLEERDIADPATIRLILAENGLDPDRVLAEAATPETTADLDAHTRSAMEAGVFGIPCWEIGGELFWGQDRLPFVERALLGEGSSTAGWLAN
jgi:2-hydroxychromene-2-carboxylate isomerase